MMKSKTTWTEKLNSPKRHEVKPAPINIAGMKAGQIMLVPTAKIVDDFIRTIPKGVSMDVKTLRAKLARKYKAEVTCPITTGYHLKTVAEAAFEAHQQGAKLREITPIWRVLDQSTPTTKRLSYDPAFIMDQRAREGL
jgi:hypothetical protein